MQVCVCAVCSLWRVNMLVILFMASVLPSLAGRAIFSWVSACRIEALSKSVTPWNMLWCVRSLSISVKGITQDQIYSNLQIQMLINFIPKEIHWKFMWLLPFFSLFTFVTALATSSHHKTTMLMSNGAPLQYFN